MVHLPQVLKSEVFLHGQKRIFKGDEMGHCKRQTKRSDDK